ncbi:MAG: serine hydrolase domain-containing protein [Planctomycetia bacterium]|nr:serine hydrolase domain-containing protein [Planctomycetia bacterium]
MRKSRLLCGIFSFVMVLVAAGSLLAESPKMVEALQPYIDRGEMPGIVSVLATKDKILQIDCVGYSNVETKTPIAADQMFWMASTSKFFAGTALMMLVDEGKVALDDPIEKYLPEMSALKVALVRQNGLQVLQTPESKPTVRQALSHQVGWPFQTEIMEKFGSDCLPLQKELFVISRTPLNFQPGKGYQYTELGIDVVGGIIEKVTGKPYEDFLQERIFDPLGMKDTTLWPSLELQQNRWIQCYNWHEEKLAQCNIPMMTKPYEDKTVRFPEPGACIFSTANDLTKFFQMHAGGGVYEGKRYLSQAAIDEMSTKQTPEGNGNDYGLTSALEGPWYGHGGACGNQCSASKDGLVRLFIVQVSGVPKHGEAVHAWKRAADAIFKEEGLR